MSDDVTPVPQGAPIEALTDADIVRYARGVITQQYMLANLNDRDWQHAFMLILSAWKEMPSNASSLFLVPMGPHQGGRWLNGRVPAVVMECVPVAIESTQPLIDKCNEFYAMLHPDEPPVDATDDEIR